MLLQELKNTLTFVLAGGRGERLKPLTLDRAKPAVPFAGQYRIIDFTLSNCLHSGLRRIFVLTQYQANSLEEHIRFGWNFLPRRLEQFIVCRAPQHREERSWYLGTADAIYHNLDTIHSQRPDYVVVLSGDHIYRMDYGRMLKDHIERGAELTIGAVRISQAESKRFGILQVDEEDRVTGFVEKPEAGPEIPGRPGYCLGSMGIYIFNRADIVRRLEEDAALGAASGHDFGHDIIPRMIPEGEVYARHFVDEHHGENMYWRDVGTIDAYYDANIDLCSPSPHLNLYDEDWPTYTHFQNVPPAKTLFEEPDRTSRVFDSLLCPGVIVSGGMVRRSVLSNRVFVDEGAEVEESNLFRGVRVGAGAKVRRAIIDKWADIPPGFEIGVDSAEDRRRFKVTQSGIVVVPRNYPFR